ncbi:pentapeptide repeat-containing protein [Streptomyces sp. NPDC053493]|uniref:pentapeptide repeat-containing protein n=1 Tax=Streptomyces sp. NPDC053493 TaxID=3365705 RepID=UPI0037D466BC
MDFGLWDDWVRAVAGVIVTSAAIVLLWRGVAKAAAFKDPHRRTGRRILLVPRRLVRGRPADLRPVVRGALALRRYHGAAGAATVNEVLARLVEADRSARVLRRGRRIWAGYVPATWVVAGLVVAAWLATYEAVMDGPGAYLPSPTEAFETVFGSAGFVEGGEGCTGFSLLRGCEDWVIPWWEGAESGFVFGGCLTLVVGAWWIRRAALRDFAVWEKQEPPLVACLEALAACRQALRTPALEASVLDMSVAELRAGLRDFARWGLPADAERRAELEAHGARVAATLLAASGRVLREGTATSALPDLVRLLAQVQDRLHGSRWYALLDDSLLVPLPVPPPGPVPPTPGTGTAGATGGERPAEAGRWQRYTAIATALPTVPALLALGFTAVTLTQARDALRVSERDQVASSYNDTVANLGDESINVRISSIYALQRIMKESPREQPAVVEVLCAYVRDKGRTPAKSKVEAAHKNAETRPPDDVQAALNVLGSRPPEVEGERVMNLRGTFLVGADFTDGNFSDADFSNADLTFAQLDGEFDNVWFHGTVLRGAALSGGEFLRSEFGGADMAGIWWDGAVLQGVDLQGVDLSGARLGFLDDRASVDLDYAKLSGANLTDADLTGASLRNAHLERDAENQLPAADLTRTNFTDADLREATLDGVDRSTAVWDGATFEEDDTEDAEDGEGLDEDPR